MGGSPVIIDFDRWRVVVSTYVTMALDGTIQYLSHSYKMSDTKVLELWVDLTFNTNTNFKLFYSKIYINQIIIF